MSSDRPEKPKIKRPPLLTICCYLSFMFGVYFGLGHLLSFVEGSSVDVESVTDSLSMNLGDLEASIEAYYKAWAMDSRKHDLLNFTLYVMGLIGVAEMFKLRKRGFFMYGVAHLLISFYPLLMVKNNAFSQMLAYQFGGFTVLFLILYGVNLKHMKDVKSNSAP